MKNFKMLLITFSVLITFSANHGEASTYVQDLKALNPALGTALHQYKIYDMSEAVNSSGELKRQATTIVCNRVIEQMANDALENPELKEKYLDSSKGIHGQYFSKNLIGFVNAVLNDAIWNNNGGDMVASFNSYGRLEVSYYEKELHKTAGFDKLLSELSDALVPGAYNFGKLVFHPDFDPTVLGMD